MFKSYREEKERKRENDRMARDNLYLRCTEIEPFLSSVGKQHTTIEKEFDIPDRIKWAAYDIITRAPSLKVTYHHDLEEYRQNTTPPGYKKAQLIRRVIQFILFLHNHIRTNERSRNGSRYPHSTLYCICRTLSMD